LRGWSGLESLLAFSLVLKYDRAVALQDIAA